MTTNFTVIWDMILYRLEDHYRHMEYAVPFFKIEDGGSMFIWNMCNNLQDYMASHPRRQQYTIIFVLVHVYEH
jgi:hypothetical protein